MPEQKILLFNLRTEKPGTKIGEYTIKLCDECHEGGILNDFYGTKVVFHGISAVPNENDGAIEMKDDVCIIAQDKQIKRSEV